MEDKQNHQFDLNVNHNSHLKTFIKYINKTLSKQPDERNSLELDKLQQQTKDIPFFKKYNSQGDKDVHIKCCKFMKNEYFKKEETIFLIDSIGTKFYLILSGKVGVYIRLPKKIQEEDQSDQTENAENIEDPLICVKQLSSGEAFGELALLNNKPRLASIIAHENTYVAVLDKKDFGLILKEKEEQKLLKEMGFFAKLPFFTGWNFNLVKLLYLNAFRVKFNRGDFVFQEGQEPVAVYIITEGQFDLEKTFDKEKRPEFWETDNQQHINKLKLINKQSKKTIRLACYTPHELFGEEDIMNKVQKRTFSAVCGSATGECIMIKKRDFFIRILREEGARQYLKQRLLNKNNRMSEKMQTIKDSIFEFQNFLYNDQEGLKKQKEVSLELFKKESFNDKIIKNHIKQSPKFSGNTLKVDNSRKESLSITELSTIPNTTKSPYAIRKSVTTFGHLISQNIQIDQNSPLISVSDIKRGSLAVNQEQFSPLLQQIKRKQSYTKRQTLKLQSSGINQTEQDEISSQTNLIKDFYNESEVKNKKQYILSSPCLEPQNQEFIRKVSGIVNLEKFNDFQTQIRKKDGSDKVQISKRFSKQNTLKNREQVDTLTDLPLLNQSSARFHHTQTLDNIRPSQSSILRSHQTITENMSSKEIPSSDESDYNQSASPKLVKNTISLQQLKIGKIGSYLSENRKLNALNQPRLCKYDSEKNERTEQSSPIKNLFKNEKKPKLFERIKQKAYTNNTFSNLNSSNQLSDENRYQTEEIKPFPKIMINSENISKNDSNKDTPNRINTACSLEQNEINLTKKLSTFSQFNNEMNNENNQKTQSEQKSKKSAIYFNSVMQTSTTDKNHNIMKSSLNEKQFDAPIQRIMKERQSMIQLSQQNEQMSPISKKVKANKFVNIHTQDLDRKKQLFSKQHVSSSQRLVDIMGRIVSKQQGTSLQNIDFNQNSSQTFLKNDDIFGQNRFNKLLSTTANMQSTTSDSQLNDKFQSSFFKGFKNHISIGTQFQSIIKQLDQKKFNQTPQSDKQLIKKVQILKQKV